jgi:hypothetical protein
MRNVLAQYNYGRELCLSGPYDAMVTVEHDMVLPAHAVEFLCAAPAPVVYATYLLRHSDPRLNAWQYIGERGLGMSLDRYPAELRALTRLGVGRVSGVGFGCTLLRRQVLEQIPFRSDPAGHAPDMPFALDCVRQGVTQLARFDVRCGHLHFPPNLSHLRDLGDPNEEVILEIDSHGPTCKVKVLQPVNVLLDGGGVALMAGDEVELPNRLAQQLLALGYVEILAQAVAAPAVPRKKRS